MRNKNAAISTLAGHSALEIFQGARKRKFKTLAIVQRGREKTYTKYFYNLIDDSVLVDRFKQLTDTSVVKRLKYANCVFIPHRYVQVYCDLNAFENNFPIPVFGNKYLLKYEEREGPFTQYDILKKEDIPYPERFDDPSKIDRLAIVKVPESKRTYERAFFFARDKKEFEKKAREFIVTEKIKKEDLNKAVIEEYLIGAQVNFNFFYSVMRSRLELLGTDIRRQTNIDGLIRIPYREQTGVSDMISPSYIESGHIAVTVKESILEKAFILAEKTLKAAKSIHPKGIIGPFALQTCILPGPPEEKIVVYDLSLRIPGSPGTRFTPYSEYLFGESISFGDRIALEIEEAMLKDRLHGITT